jgi:trk system potassium uptake protein TrkH
MRTGVVLRVLSRLLWFAGLGLLFPLVVALLYGETNWGVWSIASALALFSAYGCAHLPVAVAAPKDSLRRREGLLAVSLGWLVLVFFTALAYHMSGEFSSFAHAYFESMSGYTTDGATVIDDIEALPHSILFMRSFSHWIGGMGIIVLSVAILPELSVGGMQLFAAEASGIDSDKLAPRIAATARRLWVLYVIITAAEAVMLLLGDMSLFDAVNHAMATIATGGFSTKNDSIGGFDSLYIEIVIIFFMFISGISFTLQYRAIILGQPKRLLQSPEVRLYIKIILVAITLLTINTYGAGIYDSVLTALRYATFQTVSVITTTGFGINPEADFDMWPDFSRVLIVGIMLIGGCAGSTAGGSKVVRLYVVVKHAGVQIRRLVRPRLVQTLHIGDREVPRETTEAILGFYLLYFTIITVLGLSLTALGLDFISGTTAAVSAMNSIGPGLGTVGGVESFSSVPDAGLYLLSGGMLLGRLEIYPLLVIFSSHFWRRG